ncbi:apoptosis facilitator Bcl-2-like protein 14 isoform X1 [Lissotriton helveticus]
MNSEMETGMQEILLDDADEDSVEFRLLMEFAQRNLSDSKFQELIKNRHTQVQDEKNGKMVEQLIGQCGIATKDLPPDITLTSDSKHTKVEGNKRKKAVWRRMIPRCIRGQSLPESDLIKEGELLGMEKGTVESETSVKRAFKQEGCMMPMPAPPMMRTSATRDQRGAGGYNKRPLLDGDADRLDSYHSSDLEFQSLSLSVSVENNIVSGDAAPDPETVAYIIDHLVEILNDAPGYSSDPGYRTLRRSFSVEADGVSDDEALIQRIAAVLRESGDRLQEEIKSDKTLHQGICELFTSYNYFKKVTDLYVGDQVIEEEVEIQQQSVKIAFAMDLTTKLTAIDHHPMNKVLGFGVKYLKEKFSPWIKEHGGWEKAFSVMDLEDVD